MKKVALTEGRTCEMNELTYKQFEKGRLSGMPIREIAYKYSHGTGYYQRNGYVDRFNKDHPDFPDLRGRSAHSNEVTSSRTYKGNIDEEEYVAFEEMRLAGKSVEDIAYDRKKSKGYYYQGGYVAQFNREHPEMRGYRAKVFNANTKASANQIYESYIEHHRKGLAINEIAEKLNMTTTAVKQIISKKNYEAGMAYADHSLADAVTNAYSRKAKFDLIHDFRVELIADYGKTLMDVPESEPRLKALQLASGALK